VVKCSILLLVSWPRGGLALRGIRSMRSAASSSRLPSLLSNSDTSACLRDQDGMSSRTQCWTHISEIRVGALVANTSRVTEDASVVTESAVTLRVCEPSACATAAAVRLDIGSNMLMNEHVTLVGTLKTP
jgi:hypothetical protein